MTNIQRRDAEKINLIEEGKKIGTNEDILFWSIHIKMNEIVNKFLLAGDKLTRNAFKTTRIYL